MRAFSALRTLVEAAQQKESHLTLDRQYRRNRLDAFCAKKTNEEKQMHLVSRSQYAVKRLVDKSVKENAEEGKERLRGKCAKELNRRQNLRAHEVNVERNTSLECDRDEHR